MKDRTILIKSGNPHKLWGEAVVTAAILRNERTRTLNDRNIEKILNSRRPVVQKLCIFGGQAWIMVRKGRGKMNPKAKRGI